MVKSILHLTLHREHFDAIASRKKTVEFRELKPYWVNRLLGKCFDEIHFRNGYSKDRPFMRVAFEGYTYELYEGNRCFGIKLGKIFEIQNYSGPKANEKE